MTSSPDIAGVRPGDVLAGKYRVERLLGAGGMGVVVAAHHLQLDQRVALKFLLPDALKNAEAVGRFVREARAAVKITGDHVARVSDVGQLEGGCPYIVMEYLDGIDLSTWLKQRGPLPVELAVDFVLQACEAIADAHALGIVHRDLKPANLFCVQRSDGQPCIKVLDFGISKVTIAGAAGHDMTRTNAMVGSPFYMSPEQMQSSKAIDARTDIWSLGIVLFELVSGRVPFEAEAVTELAIKVAMDPAPPVRAFRGDVPPGVEQIIAGCLEKDRERRFATVGELAVALKDFGGKGARVSVERILGTLRQAGISGTVLPPSGEFRAQRLGSSGALQGLTPQTGASWGQGSATTKPPRNGAGIAIAALIGGVLLAALATGGAILFRRPTATTAAATRPPAPNPVTALSVTASAPPEVSALPAVSPVPSASVTAAASVVAVPTTTMTATPRPAHPPATPVQVAPPPAKSNCDPPYYYNAKGTRVFKQECL